MRDLGINLLVGLWLLVSSGAYGATFPNSFTTNSTGQTPIFLPTNSSTNLLFVMHINGDGTILQGPASIYISNNVLYGVSINNSSNVTVTNVTIYDSLTVNTNVTINQNLTVKGNATVNNITITNSIGFVTNVWSGPTNTVDMAIAAPYDLNYASFTACSITGFVNKPTYTTSEKLLSIANLSATNFDVTLQAAIVDGDFTSTHTITNGTTGMFWMRYTPQGPRTNCVFRQL